MTAKNRSARAFTDFPPNGSAITCRPLTASGTATLADAKRLPELASAKAGQVHCLVRQRYAQVMEFDNGQRIDWGLTSSDYARHRPGPPESFYEKLSALGVGLPGQRIADLGTGTGVLAREFARRGCVVSGVDVAANQVEAARLLALEGRLDVDFSVAPAEETGLEQSKFQVVTYNQCWLYFDLNMTI